MPRRRGPPADYTQTANLTQPRYETEREVIKLPAYDGEELYIEVVRPKAAGRFPVILERARTTARSPTATAPGSFPSRATRTASRSA